MENSTIDVPKGNILIVLLLLLYVLWFYVAFRFLKLLFSSLGAVDQFQDALLSWNGLITVNKDHSVTKFPF